MIKIVKEPTTYKKECFVCDCIFTFNKGDVTKDPYRVYKIKCPICKQIYEFEERDFKYMEVGDNNE